MTLEGIVAGLIIGLVGLAFAFGGFRLFLILLPIWGFLAGFLVGADVISYILGDGFLATGLGWVTGFIVGALFAVLSYLYYYVAVVLLGGSLGYAIGIGFMTWLNIGGAFAWIVAMAVAIVFAIGFVMLRMPFILIVVATAIGGATAAIAGLALILGRIKLEAFNGGQFGAVLKDELSWVWFVAMIALALAAGFYQLRSLDRTVMSIQSSQYRNPGIAEA